MCFPFPLSTSSTSGSLFLEADDRYRRRLGHTQLWQESLGSLLSFLPHCPSYIVYQSTQPPQKISRNLLWMFCGYDLLALADFSDSAPRRRVAPSMNSLKVISPSWAAVNQRAGYGLWLKPIMYIQSLQYPEYRLLVQNQIAVPGRMFFVHPLPVQRVIRIEHQVCKGNICQPHAAQIWEANDS